MRNSPLFLLIGAVIAAPAFAAGHGGGGHGMGSSMTHGNAFGVASSSTSMSHISTSANTGHANNLDTHGALVSQTAHQAKASGMKVGPQVRAVARSKSQGPSHANANAITHASSNSVLNSSTKTATRSTTTGVSIRHSSDSHR